MTTSTERKRAQRQRDKANGITTITLRVDSQEMAMILEACHQRRIAREPYEVTEYLVGLIRQDNKLLHKQLAELRKSSCRKCGVPSHKICILWALYPDYSKYVIPNYMARPVALNHHGNQSQWRCPHGKTGEGLSLKSCLW